VPDRVVDIQGYGWTDYCYGDRIITIPISFQARIPDGMTVQDLQNDVLKEMANNAFAYLIDAGENVPGAGMSWSFDKPTGKGDYHFDARGISYNHPEVLTPDFDGYILTPDGYVRKK
jgi:phage terminase large subunit GpA-like protein